MYEKDEHDFAKYDNNLDGSGTIFCHHILGLGNRWVCLGLGLRLQQHSYQPIISHLILVIIDGLGLGYDCFSDRNVDPEASFLAKSW